MRQSTFPEGPPFTITAQFNDANGDPIDYPVIIFAYTINGQNPQTVIYSNEGEGQPQITRTDTGAYEVPMDTVDVSGTWQTGWQGQDGSGNVLTRPSNAVFIITAKTPTSILQF